MSKTPVFKSCEKCLLQICCTSICDEFMQERERSLCNLTKLLDQYVYIQKGKVTICNAPPKHIKIKIRILTDKISYSNLRIKQTYENDNEWKEVVRTGL